MIKNIKQISIVSLFITLFLYQKTLAAGPNTNVILTFESPLKNIKSVSDLVLTFVDWIVQLGTVAVVLAFIYVGFQFVAAKGNPERIQKANSAFLWTVVGTLILIGSSVLVEVIKSTLTQGGVITKP